MKHFIIVKFKEDVDKTKLFAPIKTLFSDATEIEGIESVEFHYSNSSLPNRYDLMIELILSQTGLVNFDKSQLHINWKKNYGDYILSKAIFDCDK